MQEIKLTQGKTALVDDEDYERLSQFKWYAHFDGWNWYVKRSSPMINRKRTVIYMHRAILNVPKGLQCDHINGNSLDNQKKNLRFCTHQQNGFNQRNPQKGNKLGVKGVCWLEDCKKFRARISFNGKAIHLGCFGVLGDADSAYRIAEKKYFGVFARKG